jgi:hypothetical protein
LGLGVSQTYRLLNAFRRKPVTQTLIVASGGRKKGSRLLPSTVEAAIERGIETFYKTREKPRLKRLYREVRHDCLAAGLRPPSLKALSARVSARSLKEMISAREGTDAARDRFSPAVGGIRTTAPLHLVQIDHTLVDIQLADERRPAFPRSRLPTYSRMSRSLVAWLRVSIRTISASESHDLGEILAQCLRQRAACRRVKGIRQRGDGLVKSALLQFNKVLINGRL